MNNPDYYLAIQEIYSFFNKYLFEDKLPLVFIKKSKNQETFSFSITPNRWKHTDQKISHELSVNHNSILKGKVFFALNLIHEMCHIWQIEYGNPSRAGYHNAEWANKMETLGLMPSSTGKVGGERTGQKVSNYLIKGSIIDSCLKEMPEDLWTNLSSFLEINNSKIQKLNKAKSKVKYFCNGCKTNVWGKSNLSILCNDCKKSFIECK